MIQVKRIYEPPAEDDGLRLLVDRLWPRGVRREAARLDAWRRDLAPSHELRKRFGHDPDHWDAFVHDYAEELHDRQELVDDLRQQAAKQTVTLLFAAKDEQYNNAVALKAILEQTGESA